MIYTPKPDDVRPLIGVSACSAVRQDGRREHFALEQYVHAVACGAHGVPLIIPAIGSAHDMAAMVDGLDGLLLTGSTSNVEPHHYQGEASDPGTLHDPHRDMTTLPLIRMALAAHVPLLAICRGMQELNVALGGTLSQKIAEVSGHFNHYPFKGQEIDSVYGAAHPVYFHKGGFFHLLVNVDEAMVNSIHNQGIDQLAPGLIVEAKAADGVIEAVKVADVTAFAIGTQWHPEWDFERNPVGLALFDAFGTACRERASKRKNS